MIDYVININDYINLHRWTVCRKPFNIDTMLFESVLIIYELTRSEYPDIESISQLYRISRHRVYI